MRSATASASRASTSAPSARPIQRTRARRTFGNAPAPPRRTRPRGASSPSSAATTASMSASSPRNCSVRCHCSRVVIRPGTATRPQHGVDRRDDRVEHGVRRERAPRRTACVRCTPTGARRVAGAAGSAARSSRTGGSRSRSPGRRVVTASTVPSGSAMPKQTVPTATPSCSVGPATPVTAIPTSAPSTRCAPSAICRAALLAHDELRGDAEHVALHLGRVRADRAAERLARAGHVRDTRADQPAGDRLRDAERPAARPAGASSTACSIVSSSTPNTRSPRIARSSCSSASTQRARARLRSRPSR